MLLDERALCVLEVLEGSLGQREGSLLALLDRTASAPGRRRLRHWLCRWGTIVVIAHPERAGYSKYLG